MTHNAERKLSRYERADVVREWRRAFWLLCRVQRVPRLGLVAVDVHQGVHRGKLPDTAASSPAAKAAVDGALVDGGVVPDDTGEFVAWVRFFPPTRAASDSFTIRIVELIIPSDG